MRIGFAMAVLAALCLRAFAIDNIPVGQLLWLQGFEGNVITPGFEIDGTLRLEAIDEPVDISLQVLLGQITNSSTGTILINPGPGGGRAIYGSILNEGSFQVNARLDLPGVAGVLENHGTIVLGTSLAPMILEGRNCLLDQEEGSINIPSGQSSYLLIQDGAFHYNGGSIAGQVWVARGAASVSDTIQGPLDLWFFGPGCTYGGNLSAPRKITLGYLPSFGGGNLAISGSASLDGEIDLQAGGAQATLSLPTNGLTVTTNGIIFVQPSSGQSVIQGGLTVRGKLANNAPLALQSTTAITNWGNWILSGNGTLSSQSLFVAAGGLLQADGGSMEFDGGLWNQGGTFDIRFGANIVGNVTNSAVVLTEQDNPVSVQGDWSQSANGAMKLDLDPSGLDVPALQVSGKLRLAGALTLNLSPSASKALTNGQVVTVASSTGVSGSFDTVQFPALATGLRWQQLEPRTNLQFVVTTNLGSIFFQPPSNSAANGLTVIGTVGSNLLIEESTDLFHWAAFTNTASFFGYFTAPLPPAESPRRFFRASFVPAP